LNAQQNNNIEKPIKIQIQDFMGVEEEEHEGEGRNTPQLKTFLTQS